MTSNRSFNADTQRQGTAPNILVSVVFGIAATVTMLAANWMLAPQIIGLFASIERFGPFFLATSAGQLVADLAICFLFALALMCAVQLRAKPHGVVIAGCMAFVGWAIYFTEVGFFSGMLHSEYPLWYEVLSFIKYPLALTLAMYVRGMVRTHG